MWKKRTGIMLCQPLDERNLERNFKMCPMLLAQPKLDGMRCWVEWVEHTPRLWSSEGNLITGVPHIEVLLKDWAAQVGELPFDGELYNHTMKFEDIISVTKRCGDNLRDDFTNVQYHIFDIKGGQPNLERIKVVRKAFEAMPEGVRKVDVFQCVPTKVVRREDVDAQLDHYVSEGYEGIILRNPLAPYVEKRPWTILKWKPSKHDTYQVLEVVEAVSEEGLPLQRVGSLVCADRFGNTFSVGPGLGISHERASELWEMRDVLIGKYAQVYYQNLTDRGVPRFGKFSLIVEPSQVDDEIHY